MLAASRSTSASRSLLYLALSSASTSRASRWFSARPVRSRRRSVLNLTRVMACSSRPMLLPGRRSPLMCMSWLPRADRQMPASPSTSKLRWISPRTLQATLAVEGVGTLGQHADGEGDGLRNQLLGHSQARGVAGVIQRLGTLVGDLGGLGQQIADRLLPVIAADPVGLWRQIVQGFPEVMIVHPAFPAGVAIARRNPGMVRLRDITGGVQRVTDGLQGRCVLELIEPVLGQVIDGLEGRRLEVAVVRLPVGGSALAVMRFGGVKVALLQLAVVQVHHGVPVNVAAPAAIHLAVAVVVATVVVAVGVALSGHVDKVPVRGVVDQRSGGAIHRRVLVADPPATQAGVLKIIDVVGRLADDFPRTGFAARCAGGGVG